MRKFLKVGLCGAAALMVFVTGCSGKTEKETASQTESSAEQTETEAYVAEGSITLGEYKGIPVTVTKAAVTDEEVDAQIQQLLNSKAEYVEVEREAMLGDKVNIDYKGLKDGVAFEGGTDEGSDLILGSNRFIEGFESGLVGAKKGQDVTLNLTFPENYGNADLAGQAVVFEVKVNSVSGRSVPELTDEFVAEVSPEDGTVEKLKESMKELILQQKQYQIDNQRDADILHAIVENSEITCATDDVDENFEAQLQYQTNMAKMYGMDFATYAGLMGMDEDGLKAEIRKSAVEMTKQEMALEEIAAKENLTVTEEDKEALAKLYGYEDLESFIEQVKPDEEILNKTALQQKTLNFLAENAEITVAEEAETAETEAQ